MISEDKVMEFVNDKANQYVDDMIKEVKEMAESRPGKSELSVQLGYIFKQIATLFVMHSMQNDEDMQKELDEFLNTTETDA